MISFPDEETFSLAPWPYRELVRELCFDSSCGCLRSDPVFLGLSASWKVQVT